MHWVFLISFVSVLLLIYFSNRSSNAVVRWSGAIIPPLFMLYFVFIPIDFITSIIWLIAWGVAVFAALQIITVVFSLVYARAKRNAATKSSDLFKLVRPTLYICILFTAQSLVKMSVVSANMYAIDLALEMGKYVHKNGVCKQTLPGWREAPNLGRGVMANEFGSYGTQYRVSYRCNQILNEFSFQVRVNQDKSFSIFYTKHGILKARYGHYTNPVEVIINESTDLVNLSKMKYKS